MARKTPSINTSSSADISFLLLTFFLLTSNISSDQGIMRQLPKYAKDVKEMDVEVNTRNLLRVKVTNKNIVMVEGAKWTGENWVMLSDNRTGVNASNQANYGGDIDKLHELAYEFFGNPRKEPNLPDRKSTPIPEADFGNFDISNGVISLECQNYATYETYIKVHNELSRAINQLRDELSKDKYGKSFKVLDDSSDDTDKEKAKAIKKAIPMNISESTSN
ncbi:MAG: biopolymer transporter ExbD [Bacteroidales bacterium]|jgi:biopolymer transport protein ExbD|nr:biopolymer transporter ExbD [Bacteroidales bacterium]